MSQEVQRPGRITGIDAARGIALLGMIASHVMPQFNDDFEPTLVWRVAAGTSAALFALLAGVGLSLGSQKPGRGTALAARAGFILALGLLLGLIDIPAFIILTFYGVMFLLAIPLLRLRASALGYAALGFASIGALLTWQLLPALPYLDGIDPSLSTLFADPGGTLSALLFTGAYPAIPWMTYVCAGMALGKLDLRSKDMQLRIGLIGLVLWLGTWAMSALLLGPLGGKAELARSTGRMLSGDELNESLIFGLPDEFELSSGWWHATLIPHSNLSLELLNTLGVAMLVLASALFIGQRVAWALRPLAIIGSMTLSIYTLHLLFLATGWGTEYPLASFWAQIFGALLLAVLWSNISGFRQGPLEHVTSTLANKARERRQVSQD